MNPTYLVAITRLDGGGLPQQLPELASAMGLSPYDARLRLSAPPPVIVARACERKAAEALLAWLRARGHGAVACDVATLPSAEHGVIARAFELRASELLVTDVRGAACTLPHAQIIGLMRAAEVSEEVETVEATSKKLALGRAVLTGGVVRSKKVKTVETHTSSDRQDALYAFRSTGPEPIVFRERELQYQGLGAQRASTHRQNFNMLVDCLRNAAPAAVFDDRLLAGKRRLDLANVQSAPGSRVITSSNSLANQLAAYLLMHAHLQRQL
jgi:hypothetical protein